MARPAGRRRGKALSTRLLFQISIRRAGGRPVAARSGRRSYGRSVRFSSRAQGLPPFFLFMAQHRRDLQESNPHWNAVQMAKRLGRMWRNLPASKRRMYREKAERLKGRRGTRRRGRARARRPLGRRQTKNLVVCFTTRLDSLRNFLLSHL